MTRKGPEELSVADTGALLHLPGRDPAKLRTALNIPALSPGWRQSFRALAAAQQPRQEPGCNPGAHGPAAPTTRTPAGPVLLLILRSRAR
ncbi:3-alpha domain-containing protein [Streptomyces decoyicus]|uniref:3-alpha domain-containing protein n=1 Tax=Streptomyces decoyicus TaxID=249567 RepID=UPI0033A9BB2B